MALREKRLAWTVGLAFRLSVGLSIGLGAVSPRAASAQAAGAEAAGADQAEALRLFREGVALMQADQIAEAEAKLQASWDLYETYDTAANLAECEAKIGQRAEAAQHMDFAVRNLPNHVRDEMRQEMQKRATELRAALGAIRIEVVPAGAVVHVAGRKVGRSPLSADVFVEAGTAEVSAAAEGYETARAEIVARPGERAEVRLELQRVVGTTQGPTSPPIEEASDGPVLWPGFVLGGVGLVGLGVGVGLFASGSSSVSDLRDGNTACDEAGGGSPACERLASDLDGADSLRTGGAIAMTAGGVVAAGGVGYLLWAVSRRGGERSSTSLQPAPAPGLAGFAVRGAF